MQPLPRSAYRRRARELGFSKRLSHLITVPPGPDGRPGETLMATSRNQRTGVIATDGSRSDCDVWLSRRGSSLLVVCLGDVAHRGTPMESAHRAITYHNARKFSSCVEQPRPSRMADGDAVEYMLKRANAQTLREWKFEREGWLFAAGLLLHPLDPPAVEALGRSALATWTWIPGTATSVIAPLPARDTAEVSASVVIQRSPAEIWSLVRSVEHSALLEDNVVEAFHVPGTPEGIGEQQAVVVERAHCRHTTIAEILDLVPYERIVTTFPLIGDPDNRMTYRLEETSAGTKFAITMRYSVNRDAERATRQAERTTEALQDYTARVKRVLDDGWRDV